MISDLNRSLSANITAKEIFSTFSFFYFLYFVIEIFVRLNL